MDLKSGNKCANRISTMIVIQRVGLFLSGTLGISSMPIFKKTVFRSKVKFMRVSIIRQVRCGYCHAPCVDDKNIYNPCQYLNYVILHSRLGFSYIPSDYANQKVKNF